MALGDKRPRCPLPMILAMRQLTSPDQQFLALEDGRTHGHASALGVYDPKTIARTSRRVLRLITRARQDEPVERFAASTARCVLRKERHRRLPASLLEEANDFIPPALFARTAKATVRVTSLPGIQAPVNVAISNVPGSPQPLCCAGALQRSQYPVSGVLDGLGLNITVVSYRDQLEFGVVADREQLEDPWQLIAALTDALAELREAQL